MPAHLRIQDRVRDTVALYDITHQSAKTVLALLHQRLAASTDETETAYWRTRIADVEQADAELHADTPGLLLLAQQDRWIAEAHYLDATTDDALLDQGR